MRRLGLALLLLFVPLTMARADGVPAGAERREYSYEIENLADFPDHLLVAYPVVCDWMGGGSYARDVTRLDRHLADLLDYEVLRPGRRYRPVRHCSDTRLYVVAAKGWKVEPIGSAPGRGIDETDLVHVAELDALEVDGRDKFFRGKEGVFATGYKLDREEWVPENGPLRGAHDVLVLESRGDKFRVFGRTVTYTFRDGTQQIREYRGKRRPAPGTTGDQPATPAPTPTPEPAPTPAPAEPAPTKAPSFEDLPPGASTSIPRPDLAEPDDPLAPVDEPEPTAPWTWPLAAGALALAAAAAFMLRRRT